MRRHIRSFAGILLAAVLAVTSLSAAFARGQADPVGSIVICRGLTVINVLVDADGNPVEARHVCPDAALSLFVDSGLAGQPDPGIFVLQAIRWQLGQVASTALAQVEQQARGPPLVL